MSLILEAVKYKVKSTRLEKNFVISGRVSKFDGVMISCDGFPANIGTLCSIETDNGQLATGEIVGFKKGENILSVYESGARIKVGAKVQIKDVGTIVKVGPGLLGRVIDALGDPLDEKESPMLEDEWPLLGKSVNPLLKNPITEPLDVGVRVINSVISIGKGQRVGIIAGSGVGKSVLLGMMTKFTEADIIVVGLIGERGREVKEFIDENLGEEGLKRSIVIAAASDQPPLVRLRGAYIATTIAEYFRDQGQDVMLMMDSVTRFALAQREIGLSVGEPPTTRGFTPSVFSLLPKLLERAGTSSSEGSITGLYTVLVEGDDISEPISDAVRAILDGHIVLIRELAAHNHYPAIDILNSVSRLMIDVVTKEHQEFSMKFKDFLATYKSAEDLINIGAYTKGSNPKIDMAIHKYDQMIPYLRQGMLENFDWRASLDELKRIMEA